MCEDKYMDEGDKEMKTEAINPGLIVLRHDTDSAKVEAIAESMTTAGWIGRPVVVYDRGDDRGYANITGCHRLAAADIAGIEAPAIIIGAEWVDECECAAASDDYGAADCLRAIDPTVAELVLLG